MVNFVENFFHLTVESDERSFLTKVVEARGILKKSPSAMLFYSKWRHHPGWIRTEFESLENQLNAQLGSALGIKGQKLLLFRILLHGFVTAPFFEDSEIPALCNAIEKEFGHSPSEASPPNSGVSK